MGRVGGWRAAVAGLGVAAGCAVTWRRWQYDIDRDEEKKPPIGPLEMAVGEELEVLGYNPLTPPGPLRTAAMRALSLAETIDRSMNAAALPGMDRQLGTVMDEARRASVPDETGLAEDREEEVSDFERERQRRRGTGPSDPPAVGGPATG